jgi:hypothetical protein
MNKFSLLFGPFMLSVVLSSPASAIEQFQARDLSNQQYKARDLSQEQYKARDLSASQGSRNQGGSSQAAGDPGSLLGAWKTNVGGGVWTSPSAFPGWETLHISAGALSGLLVIYPDHTYVWNAYGGKKGRWEESGDATYPIKLEDRREGRIWMVGLDRRHAGRIFVRDTKGYYYYQGSRAR